MHGSDGNRNATYCYLDEKKQYVDSSKGSWHISITGKLQNNATAEDIVISCSLVLSLVSETEMIGSKINYDRRPRVWLSF